MSLEIKICGLTNVEDAQAAVSLGADYLGFIFYPKSSRAMTPEQVTQVLQGVRGSCKAVGVFVNWTLEQVEKTVKVCGLWAAQIHGDETADAFDSATVRLWRALKVASGGIDPDPTAWSVERFVVDASVPGQYGGTGVTADWDKARDVACERPVLLAGGLTPENIASAVARVHPCGVDVVTGVESTPGRKDHAKMEAFMKRAREAAAREKCYAEE